MQQDSDRLLTHKPHNSVADVDLDSYRNKLQAADPSTLALPLDVELDLLHQLSEFDLGRFLLAHKGLNGYWAGYVNLYLHDHSNLRPLERWLLQSCPWMLATRERFKTFKRVLQENLRSGVHVASVPCGCMDDLLSLNYAGLNDIKIVGIDLDDQALEAARKNALRYGHNNYGFIKKDAWRLQNSASYDIITSNALAIYEPDDQKVAALYKELHDALKPGGLLLTSFLTPPPTLSAESSWKNYNQADVVKQDALLGDVVGVRWQSFRTEQQTRAQLEAAGLKVIEVIYDSQGMFPTVIAKRPAAYADHARDIVGVVFAADPLPHQAMKTKLRFTF